MSDLVLGIDGGGTKTLAIIVNTRGQVLGVGVGGPSNVDDVGVAAATASIETAVRAALEAAGRQTSQLERALNNQFAAVFLGIAGVVSARDRALIHGIAQSLGLAQPERILVDHDCRIALAGGLSGRPGIVLIAGTGSSCFGADASGNTWRAGGWGSLISDEGSGYWFGREGLTATVRALDGRGPSTAITTLMLERLEVTHPDDLLHRLYVTGISRAEVAGLATVVLDAARGQDAVACQLIAQGSALLAECVAAVAARLDFGSLCEVALVGGIFRSGNLIVDPLRSALRDVSLTCNLRVPERPPALGACLLALEHLGALKPAMLVNLNVT